MTSERYVSFEQACLSTPPMWFVVLGSGLGVIGHRLEPIVSIPFNELPGMPSSTIAGHRGVWTLVRWSGTTVLVSEGRVHYYEGHPWEVVTWPMHLARKLGAKCALLTNAAGGIRHDLGPGSLMPIRDHLEWNRPHPWREPVAPSPYSRPLLDRVMRAATDLGLTLVPGVYASVTGPSYETPAEIRALQHAGADAVGMSTTREVLAGEMAGMQCAAVSLVTNRAAGLTGERLSHEEVIAIGKASASRLAGLVERVLRL